MVKQQKGSKKQAGENSGIPGFTSDLSDSVESFMGFGYSRVSFGCLPCGIAVGFGGFALDSGVAGDSELTLVESIV